MLATDLKTGKIYKKDGAPHQVVKYSHSKVARGGATIKVRVRNLITGKVSDESYGSNDSFDEADVIRKSAQYLYKTTDKGVFMDPTSYEQVEIELTLVDGDGKFLKEGEKVQVMYFEGNPVAVELQNTVVLEVIYTEPGYKGNTVSNVLKDSKMENDAIYGAMPSEGTVMGVDVLVIPKGAEHPAAAHLFMDYILRPDINALLISTIGYGTNHTESGNMLPEEMKSFPGVMPSDEYLSKCEFISPKAYTGKGLELREKIWEELRR